MKKIIILISTMLSMMLVSGCTNNDVVLNTEEDALKYLIESDFMDVIGEENLAIVDTVNIEDSKIITFLSDTGQGYMVAEKNEKGNYIMTDNMANGIDEDGLGVTDFTATYNTMDELENNNIAYVVISDGSKVSSVEMSINDHIFTKDLGKGMTSVVIPNVKGMLSKEELGDNITFDCKYFNEDNKEIEIDIQ